MTTKKVSEYLKYEFSAEETKENAKKLARKSQQLVELELKKKQLMSDLKGEIDGAAAEAATLARWVNDEYDFRMVECTVLLNSPLEGLKTMFRIDTGETVKEEKMTAEENQKVLELR